MTTYEVKGRGRFPIDALRAANAWPSAPGDADKIAMSLLMIPEPKKKYGVTICSRRRADVRLWASFGWDVV